VVFLLWVQFTHTMQIFYYVPFSDIKNNIVEGVAVIFNSIAIVCVAFPLFVGGSKIDDLSLLIISSLGTIFVALADLLIIFDALYEQTKALKRVRGNKILDDHGTQVPRGAYETTDNTIKMKPPLRPMMPYTVTYYSPATKRPTRQSGDRRVIIALSDKEKRSEDWRKKIQKKGRLSQRTMIQAKDCTFHET